MLPTPDEFLAKVYSYGHLKVGEKGYSGGVDFVCETIDDLCLASEWGTIKDILAKSDLDKMGTMSIHLLVFSSWAKKESIDIEWAKFRDKVHAWWLKHEPADRVAQLFQGLTDE